jgi:hypothetical protein
MSAEELAAESVTALPDKEVLSLLDLNANIDLAVDAAAPIDLAIGANANIAAPIQAAASANVLSPDAMSAAEGTQVVAIGQTITGDANAHGLQDSTLTQGTSAGGTTPIGDTTQPVAPTSTVTGGVTDGNLLDVNVNLHGGLDLAAPINGAVAANANAAAPIDAAVSANIGSPGAESVAVADQTAIIDQTITGDANAVSDQTSVIGQGTTAGTSGP